MDQTCARVSALQLARLEESSRRMATGLRGVEPEENRGPEHRLIPEKIVHNTFSGKKTEPPTVPRHLRCRIKSTTPRTLSCGTNSWGETVAQDLYQLL
jgi:hypothetical protein